MRPPDPPAGSPLSAEHPPTVTDLTPRQRALIAALIAADKAAQAKRAKAA